MFGQAKIGKWATKNIQAHNRLLAAGWEYEVDTDGSESYKDPETKLWCLPLAALIQWQGRQTEDENDAG